MLCLKGTICDFPCAGITEGGYWKLRDHHNAWKYPSCKGTGAPSPHFLPCFPVSNVVPCPQAVRRARSTDRVVLVRSVLAAQTCGCANCEQIVRDSRAGLAPSENIINAYYEHKHLMLFKMDLSVAPWSAIINNAAIVEFLEEAVRTQGLELSAHQWDLIVISLCSLVNSLRLSAHQWNCNKVAIIARAVLTLLGSVHEFVSSVQTKREQQPSAHVLALPAKWADDIEPYLTRHIVELVMVVLELDYSPMTSCRLETMDALIASLQHLRRTAVSSAPSLRAVCARAADALRRDTHAAYKYLAAAVLDFVTEALVLDDAEKLAACGSRENVTPRPEYSLRYFDDAMMDLQEQVDAALSGVEVCEGTRELQPGSDGHSAALGLLLLAAHLMRQCARARGDRDLAKLYIELLSEGAHVGGLMANTMRLLPRDVLDAKLESAIHPVPMHCWSAFEDMPPLDVYRWCDADTVASLACFVLCETLGGLAVGEAEDWAYTLSPSAGATLRRIVIVIVAPLLRRRLLNQLCESAHELPEIHLSIEWSRAEVSCELQLEEDTIELTLQLADLHPLVLPTIDSSLMVEPDMHSIALYLTYENGTLINAVKMWIDTVTAYMQRSPQCLICFDRLHSVSGILPTEACIQCRKKFHMSCLLKWFWTRGNSNCPVRYVNSRERLAALGFCSPGRTQAMGKVPYVKKER
ncbi:unnamed protein product [Euphydryas editha]|uniref:E3 ubiquitin-protein ligase listerin n=1 Tax=Euphydryas editha TaxID=104508 RepID=A0AAU9TVK7_EUPED|nr:unnamed protein product [Euphydryas editha]